VSLENRGYTPPGHIMFNAAPARPAKTAPPTRVEPSWGRVLATTVKLRVGRLRPAGHGPWRPGKPGHGSWRPGKQSRKRYYGPLRRTRNRYHGPLRRPVAWRWRLITIALALAVGAVAALQFAGVFTRTATPGAPPVRGASPAGPVSPAAAAQSQAATWIASQVSGDAIIACYPVMCAALQAQGVLAGRLMPMRPGTVDPAGANVMVTAPSVSSTYAAPALIASFGSGKARIEVRATEAGGAAAYAAALRADLAARKSAGTQLLRNWHITFTAQDATQLRAGQVDSRLLATLAALAAQYSFQVTAFGDASPGAAAPLREVTITAGPGGTLDLKAALALVREQTAPYLPARAALTDSSAGSRVGTGSRAAAGSRAALSIEFAAPGPLGLLTAVLADNPQRVATPTAAIAGAFPLGWAWI
jgi:hypothetical protein